MRAFQRIPLRAQPPPTPKPEKRSAITTTACIPAPRRYTRLMDRMKIRYPTGAARSSFCDLYAHRKELIYVKRYRRSSTLSRLSAQGVTSATLLAHDAGFRRVVNAKLPATTKSRTPPGPCARSHHRVTYAIIPCPVRTPSPFLLFCKVTLIHATNALHGLGYKVQTRQNRRRQPPTGPAGVEVPEYAPAIRRLGPASNAPPGSATMIHHAFVP